MDAAEIPWGGLLQIAMQWLVSVVAGPWLGGAMGLWTWGRQRQGLLAVAQARELARAQAQRRESQLHLSVLAAQVEPHFLFNTLAGLRSAIRTDPGRASDMIDRLVDHLRAALPRLRSDGGADATLGPQLKIVRAYLGLMRSRLPRLSFAIDAPAGQPGLGLALQTAVNPGLGLKNLMGLPGA